MANGPPPSTRVALLWVAAIAAAYTIVRLLDPPPPNVQDDGDNNDQGSIASVDLPGQAQTTPELDLAVDDIIAYPCATSFGDVEWLWAMHNRQELTLASGIWPPRAGQALLELRGRLSQAHTSIILRPDPKNPFSQFEIVPNGPVFRLHPLYFMTWQPIFADQHPEQATFSASPLPSPPAEALTALLHAMEIVQDGIVGLQYHAFQSLLIFLQVDAWMREFAAADIVDSELQLRSCQPRGSRNASSANYPSDGSRPIGTRRVDWMLHASLHVVAANLLSVNEDGLGLTAESQWDELRHEEFDDAFKDTPREVRPSAAAGLAGFLALLESVVAAVLTPPVEDLVERAVVQPAPWPIQMRALAVLTAAEADPVNGPLSDAFLDALGVAADGSIRGTLRRFLVRVISDGLMPSLGVITAFQATLVGMRTAVHMLLRGASLRGLVSVPKVSYDPSCSCAYVEATDPLREVEHTLLDGAALNALVYERGEGYESTGNLSVLAADSLTQRRGRLRREWNCRYDAAHKSESLLDAAHIRSSCLLRDSEGLDEGGALNESSPSAFPTFPVPDGLPAGRCTGIRWLNALGVVLAAAVNATENGGGNVTN